MINTTDIFNAPQELRTYIYNKLNELNTDYAEIKTEIEDKKLEGGDVGGKYIAVSDAMDILTNGEIISIIVKLKGFNQKTEEIEDDVLRVFNIKINEIEKLLDK